MIKSIARFGQLLVPKTLYHKIAIIFWLIVFCLAAAQYYLATSLSSKAQDRRDQMFYSTLASDLSQKLALDFAKKPNDSTINIFLSEAHKVNPRFDLYLIDSEGNILYTNQPNWKRLDIIKKKISVEPIAKYLKFEVNKQIPIYGENPSNPKHLSTFSTYPIKLGDISGYLYVILQGDKYQGATRGILDYYATYTSMLSYSLLTLFTLLMGTLLFLIVTRRFRKISETVRKIANGEIESRTRISGNDELGELGTQIDIMASQIQETLFALKEVDSKRRDFVAKMSHDLRGPLTSAKGFTESLEQEISSENSEAKNSLKYVSSNLDRLEQMIADLLELSKLEMIEHSPRAIEFDVVELVEEEIIPRCRFNADKYKIKVLATYNDTQEYFVNADIQLIERVLFNLIDNAIRYNKEGGKVEIALKNLPEGVQINVIDSGLGIEEKEIHKIFDTFYRSSKNNIPGSGLGLAIVKLIVEAHGGKITVKSKLHEGSNFGFQLPKATS